jgi:hypothetical protein
VAREAVRFSVTPQCDSVQAKGSGCLGVPEPRARRRLLIRPTARKPSSFKLCHALAALRRHYLQSRLHGLGWPPGLASFEWERISCTLNGGTGKRCRSRAANRTDTMSEVTARGAAEIRPSPIEAPRYKLRQQLFKHSLDLPWGREERRLVTVVRVSSSDALCHKCICRQRGPAATAACTVVWRKGSAAAYPSATWPPASARAVKVSLQQARHDAADCRSPWTALLSVATVSLGA